MLRQNLQQTAQITKIGGTSLKNLANCFQKPLENCIRLAIGCLLNSPCLITYLAIFWVSYLETQGKCEKSTFSFSIGFW